MAFDIEQAKHLPLSDFLVTFLGVFLAQKLMVLKIKLSMFGLKVFGLLYLSLRHILKALEKIKMNGKNTGAVVMQRYFNS